MISTLLVILSIIVCILMIIHEWKSNPHDGSTDLDVDGDFIKKDE